VIVTRLCMTVCVWRCTMKWDWYCVCIVWDIAKWINSSHIITYNHQSLVFDMISSTNEWISKWISDWMEEKFLFRVVRTLSYHTQVKRNCQEKDINIQFSLNNNRSHIQYRKQRNW
jgi:hypothetical protein